jgi:tape measure domain-containing protein
MAAQYGFTITTTDEASSKLQNIQGEINKTVGTAQKAGQEISGGLEKAGHGANILEQQFSHIGGIIAGAFALHSLKEFGQEVFNTTREFEGFYNRIKFTSTSSIDLGNNINFLNDTIKNLNLPMHATYEQFSEMKAGMIGTGIEGEKARKVFLGLATAATTLHLDPNQFSRASYALKVMAEEHQIESRHLRELSMAMPDSLNLMAEAAGKSVKEFKEAMKSGTLDSSAIIVKFGELLKTTFEDGAEAGKSSLQGLANEAETAMTKVKLALGEKLEPLFKSSLKGFSAGLGDFADTIKGMDLHAEGIGKLLKTVVQLGLAYGGLRLLTMGFNTALAVSNTLEEAAAMRTGLLNAGMNGLQATTMTLNATISGFSTGLIALGATGAIFGLMKIKEAFDDIDDAIIKAAKDKYDFDNSKSKSEGLQESVKGVATDYKTIQDLINKGDASSKIKAQRIGGGLLGDIPDQIAKFEDETAKLVSEREGMLKEFSGKDMHKKHVAMGLGTGGGNNVTEELTIKGQQYMEMLTTNNGNIQTNNKLIAQLKETLTGLKKLGIKVKPEGGKEGGTAADSIGMLSGANGGLDKAKIINIKVDTMQKIGQITGIDDYRKATAEAIDTMIRMFNNISNGSAATV